MSNNQSTKRRISIFGVTGSIGRSARDVILAHPEKFEIICLTAGKNVSELASAAIELGARQAVIADQAQYGALKEMLAGTGITCAAGNQALLEAAAENVDIAVMAIVGMAGLGPLMAAMPHAKAIAIANKEPLVAAGPFVMRAAKEHNVKILPLDSEHNAIFQVFEERNRSSIERLILTASGGPFLNWPADRIAKASIDEALAHPNWSMGAKISVDSATMMNKALEIIEAHYLFDMPSEKIDVLVHPQSVVHSMVEYNDGSILAQMGASDMRTPIAYALGWPDRIATPGKRLDFRNLGALEFRAVDDARFPSIGMAYQALRSGLGFSIGFNAANEVAVQAFLDGRIAFGDIIRIVELACDKIKHHIYSSVEDIEAFDAEMRLQAQQVMSINSHNKTTG